MTTTIADRAIRSVMSPLPVRASYLEQRIGRGSAGFNRAMGSVPFGPQSTPEERT
jgi:hypothetical protein